MTLAFPASHRYNNCNEGPALKPFLSLAEHIDQKVFTAIYSRSLVYNTCWEYPAVDRQVLQRQPKDNILVITSAGCNALDYGRIAPLPWTRSVDWTLSPQITMSMLGVPHSRRKEVER